VNSCANCRTCTLALCSPDPPSIRSRMDVVGSEDEMLFKLTVSFGWTVQLRSAVPALTATLRPDVFPLDLRRIQPAFDPVPPRALSVTDRQPPSSPMRTSTSAGHAAARQSATFLGAFLKLPRPRPQVELKCTCRSPEAGFLFRCSPNPYLNCQAACPICRAAFNPRCKLHYHLYFDDGD